MLFVAFFLWVHFLIHFLIVSLSYSDLVCNPAGPFGIILPRWFIVGVSLAIVVSIFSIVSKNLSLSFQWPWLLVLSGGLGNLLERIFFGCIMDYIHISSFPVFNMADMLLTLGVVVILLRWYIENRKRSE